MTNTVFVKAAQGQWAPREGAFSGRITGVAESVPNSRYYRRLISDGSLVVVNPPAVMAVETDTKDKKRTVSK